MDVYVTHCCAKKNDEYRNIAKAITPQELYVAAPTQRFMRRCVEMGVRWAIFSDKYGVWFPEVLHEWYEKDPRTVTPEEFQDLKQKFDDSLRDFTKISFYANP